MKDRREYFRQYFKDHREKYLSQTKKYYRRLKMEVLLHYGKGKAACVRCGFSDARALSIDHMNGRGREHRENVVGHGTNIYQWLRTNGFPKGFQTLCMNCQFIKRVEQNEVPPGHRSKTKRRWPIGH
jgi:hypothetical protein